VRSTFTVLRRGNPDGIVFANVGAGATVEEARAAVEMLEADALQLHLNVLQELIMPKGDRDFRHLAERIAAIVASVPVPVMVKEVGFGLSGDVVRRLARLGVTAVDIGGRGGTNFAVVAGPLSLVRDARHRRDAVCPAFVTIFAPASPY